MLLGGVVGVRADVRLVSDVAERVVAIRSARAGAKGRVGQSV